MFHLRSPHAKLQGRIAWSITAPHSLIQNLREELQFTKSSVALPTANLAPWEIAKNDVPRYGCWQRCAYFIEVIHPPQEVSPVELQSPPSLLVSPTLFNPWNNPLSKTTPTRDDWSLRQDA